MPPTAIPSNGRALAEHLGSLFAQAHAAHQRGEFAVAHQLYAEVLRLAPGQPDALQALGVLFLQSGQPDEAQQLLEAAVQARPDAAAAHYNLALARAARHDLDAAAASFGRAAALQPGHAAAHFNRGNALLALGRHAEAVASLEAALALRPQHVASHVARGHACVALDRFDAAAASYETTLALDPGAEFVAGHLLDARLRLCDWTETPALLARIEAGIRAGRRVSPPFQLLAVADDPQLQREAARIWLEANGLAAAAPPPRPLSAAGRRLRVGYYSADFHDHATLRLLAGVIEAHSRADFEWFAFSYGPERDDAMRQRVRAAVDRFVDVARAGDEQIVQQSRELGIDIAIDLKGFTAGSRLRPFALRCAPVQVTWLGYPGTTAAPFIDYVLADKMVLPPALRAGFGEHVAWLPGSYQPNDARRPAAGDPPSRAAAGLPAEGFVFCCFNAAYKITPARFASWMEILQRVPGAVLWLLEDHPVASANLRRSAQGHGIAPERLVFAPFATPAEHLARLRAAGLFLDTAPCNAHTTASDALRAGLPVLTAPGASFVSRVAASLVHAAGLPELCVGSEREYVECAVTLARSPAELAALQSRLGRHEGETLPLFDTARTARSLEAAYRHMHERALAGLPPADFDVEA